MSLILVPLAQYGFAVPLLFASMFIGSFVNPVYNINQVSLRQAIVPDRVQGRMNATVRTIIWGTNPIGAFIGGIIGSTYGIVPALYAGIGVSLLRRLLDSSWTDPPTRAAGACLRQGSALKGSRMRAGAGPDRSRTSTGMPTRSSDHAAATITAAIHPHGRRALRPK